MRYVALDFETGNASRLSACALGVSIFEDAVLVAEQTTHNAVTLFSLSEPGSR